jgi:5'-3' exonuclease
MVTALIDADIVCFMAAASAELEPLDVALLRADYHMRDILEATEAVGYKAFLSGANNFRYEVNPYYKANRTAPDPIHREAVKEFLITEWGASVTDGYEADDALGINQTEDTIICSIDKDLKTIPGKHYSWPILRKGVVVREASITTVSEVEAMRYFYKQMLIGDSSDNVIGATGIGKVKAAKIIDPLTSERAMFNTARAAYADDSRFFMNCDCLYIWRVEGERFTERTFVKEWV